MTPPLSSAAIFWAPVVFALVAIFSAWVYYASRKGWPEKPAPAGRLYRCAGCGRVYVEPRRVPMSRCPVCDRLNEAPAR